MGLFSKKAKESERESGTPVQSPLDVPVSKSKNSENSSELPGSEELFEWCKPVQDPELFLSIVELGLVYDIEVITTDESKNLAKMRMTLTSPGCPAGDYIIAEMSARLKEHSKIDEAEVEIVWEPKWDPKTMASEDVKEVLGIW